MTGIPNGRPIGWDEVEQLFVDFRFTAFRLETLQTYGSEYESEHFQNFISEEQQGIPASVGVTDWDAEVEAGIAAGRRYERVHVVTEPLTDYVRFECAWGYRRSIASGEDVRILPVTEGDWPDGLPHLDFWLFDSRQLLWMNFAEDSSLVSTELVDDPEWIVAANTWRDHAMQRSIPFVEYETRFDTYMHPR
ncbi:hypothetical protein FHX37_2174 [Haloactinospora alba]|uniref:DUF6879 domain-containing protein n=1 Tax=Haloactinospora alba TaxID=405555 RepID=A0A543NKA4_9ACTN|nr:DUF6879 family protein [Haloactinospora alba]TQN32224.1 hypothetical protein FHX37_2174 [Haloactinospora alba]